MARTMGATNRRSNLPAVYTLSTEQRLEMLAAILTDIISEELCKAD